MKAFGVLLTVLGVLALAAVSTWSLGAFPTLGSPHHMWNDAIRAHAALPSCEVHFAKGKLAVPVGASDNLKAICERMDRNEEHLEVVGNASAPGEDLRNLGLGLLRANIVKRLAISYGVPADRIVVATNGEDLPQYPQDTPAGQLEDQVVRVQVVGDNERNARGFKMRR